MSCIDFILASQDLASNITDAVIDKEQLYVLSKFSTTKGVPSFKKSDHYTIIVDISVKWEEDVPGRKEIFKLRDSTGLARFKELTSNNSTLQKCLQANIPLEQACSKWYKEFDKLLHQCFKKIRIKKHYVNGLRLKPVIT